MGKLLRQQRRGKGSPTYSSSSHRNLGKTEHGFGIVTDIVHDSEKKSPVVIVKSGDKEFLAIARKGEAVGTDYSSSEIGSMPEGTKIFNIEIVPGDNGKLCRSPGSAASILSHEGEKTTVLLPSKKKKTLLSKCMAVIGSPAGAGRIEKPFMKAGKMHHAMRAVGKLYPHTSGVSMNPLDHPFGGKTKPGKHKSVSRHMPPGKKVGSISPRRTGKKK
ncbi:MAG TPA: 50S ribosomal protein L2 [archaeon]|nr:50S ribosomal protein L2 [archaeon]